MRPSEVSLPAGRDESERIVVIDVFLSFCKLEKPMTLRLIIQRAKRAVAAAIPKILRAMLIVFLQCLLKLIVLDSRTTGQWRVFLGFWSSEAIQPTSRSPQSVQRTALRTRPTSFTLRGTVVRSRRGGQKQN